jgi:hypothetical protein
VEDVIDLAVSWCPDIVGGTLYLRGGVVSPVNRSALGAGHWLLIVTGRGRGGFQNAWFGSLDRCELSLAWLA